MSMDFFPGCVFLYIPTFSNLTNFRKGFFLVMEEIIFKIEKSRVKFEFQAKHWLFH